MQPLDKKLFAFQKTQLAFAQHLRAPDIYPAPFDIEDRRIQIYRELIYNNIEDLVVRVFPVLRSVLSDEHWHKIMREFIHKHQCQTPYFLQISQEFLQYLLQEREQQENDPPYLVELAYYEWIELALDVSDEIIPDKKSLPPNLLDSFPRVSPLAVCLTYQYPVHQISENNPLPNPEVTQLVVYRNRVDQVHFMAANSLTARLLYLLQNEPEKTFTMVLKKIAAELQHPQPERLITGAESLLLNLYKKDILSHFD